MRQVADGGKSGVMGLRCHLAHMATDGSPYCARCFYLADAVLRQGREDGASRLVERAFGMLNARDFFARNRVGRHIYKIYGLKEVDFIEHLFVKTFTKHNLGTIIGEINLINFKASFHLNYQILDDYVLVYALNKITHC